MLVGHGQRIDAARGTLQPVVDDGASEPPVRARLVVAVDGRIAGHHDERHLAGPEVVARRRGVAHEGPDARRGERLERRRRPRPVFDVDEDGRRGSVPEGDPERGRQDHREAERPEHGARLPEEEPETGERELEEGRARPRRFSHAGLVR